MTTDHTTEPSAVSRRTILRTTANAAWMVPAISLATSVPAMAACSTETAAHFTVSNAAGNRTNVTASSWKQSHTVTATGIGGTAVLTLSVDSGLLSTLLSTWNINAPAGWVLIGNPGQKASSYSFSRAFDACGESNTAEVTVTASALSGLLSILLALPTTPKFTATVSPS